MRYKEITEAPQLIAPLDWNLSVRRDNLARAAGFHSHPSEVFRDYPFGQLLVQAGNVGGQIGLISKTTGLLEYYVHYETSTDARLLKCASQVKLWRSPYASVRGLAHIAFDEILLARFDTVVSDIAQTDRGREFWIIQISAYTGSKTVGFIDQAGIRCFDHSIAIDDWIAQQNGWGKERSYRRKRFFISNLPRSAIEDISATSGLRKPTR